MKSTVATGKKTGIIPPTKTFSHKKAPDQIEAFRMHVDRRNNRISDTRIFSPLLARPSKHGA
jgi:hypothetical protein